MSWVLDAIKEPFQRKKSVTETDEERLLRLKREIDMELSKLPKQKKTEEVKKDTFIKPVEEERLPPMEIPEAPLQETKEAASEEPLTAEQRIAILEDNMIAILEDINARITALERSFIKMNAEQR